MALETEQPVDRSTERRSLRKLRHNAAMGRRYKGLIGLCDNDRIIALMALRKTLCVDILYTIDLARRVWCQWTVKANASCEPEALHGILTELLHSYSAA